MNSLLGKHQVRLRGLPSSLAQVGSGGCAGVVSTVVEESRENGRNLFECRVEGFSPPTHGILVEIPALAVFVVMGDLWGYVW